MASYQPTIPATKLDSLPLMLKTKNVAQMLNCSEKHVGDLLREGALRGVKIGSTWRVPRAAILEMIGE